MLPSYFRTQNNGNPEIKVKVEKNWNSENFVNVGNNISVESSHDAVENIVINVGSKRVYFSVDGIFPDGPLKFDDLVAKWNHLSNIFENRHGEAIAENVVSETQQASSENKTVASKKAPGEDTIYENKFGLAIAENVVIETQASSENKTVASNKAPGEDTIYENKFGIAIAENVVSETQQAAPENKTVTSNKASGKASSLTVVEKNSVVELNSTSVKTTTGYLNGNTKQRNKAHQAFSCQLCSKILQSQRNLENHIAKIHNGPKVRSSEESEDRPYTCSVCEMRFKTKHTRNKHEGIHRAFYTKSTYSKKHENIRNVDHPRNPLIFSCSLCKKSFREERGLKRHQIIHSENRPRPNKCSMCEKAFYDKYAARRHEKSHKLEKL